MTEELDSFIHLAGIEGVRDSGLRELWRKAKTKQLICACSPCKEALRVIVWLCEGAALFAVETQGYWRCQDYETSLKKSCGHGVELASKRLRVLQVANLEGAELPKSLETQTITYILQRQCSLIATHSD